MLVFDAFEVLQNPAFIEDDIEMQFIGIILRYFVANFISLKDVCAVLKITFIVILIMEKVENKIGRHFQETSKKFVRSSWGWVG